MVYRVKAVLFRETGTGVDQGYVPMIVDDADILRDFAVYDGVYTGNHQPRFETEEEALAYYDSCQQRQVGSDKWSDMLRMQPDLYKRLQGGRKTDG